MQKTWKRLSYQPTKNIYSHFLTENEIEDASFFDAMLQPKNGT